MEKKAKFIKYHMAEDKTMTLNITDVCTMCFGNETTSWIHNISFNNIEGILTFSSSNTNGKS